MSKVHNHGPKIGPGLSCGERRLPDGSRRGWCIGPQVGERVAIKAENPGMVESGERWRGFEARLVAPPAGMEHRIIEIFALAGIDLGTLEPIGPRPDGLTGLLSWPISDLRILPPQSPREHLEEIAPLAEQMELEAERESRSRDASAAWFNQEPTPMSLAWSEHCIRGETPAVTSASGLLGQRGAFEAGWKAALATGAVLITPDPGPREDTFEGGRTTGLHQAANVLRELGGGA